MTHLFKNIALAGAFTLLSATAAFAHAHLKSATPAADSTVAAAPAELSLSFSEDLNLKFSSARVIGPDKAEVKTGEGALKDDNTTLVVPLPAHLAAGAYDVEWHVLSADGHKTKGAFRFTIKP